MNFINLKQFEHCDIEINSRQYCYDLHNNANFIELRYFLEKNEVNLVWNYPSERFLNAKEWADNKEYLIRNDVVDLNIRKIALIFENVSILKVDPRDIEIPLKENKTLSAISLYDENFKTDCVGFDFISGLKIIIKAESVYFDRNYKFH